MMTNCPSFLISRTQMSAIASFILLLSLVPSSQCDTGEKIHLQKGIKHYNDSSFEEAIVELNQALESGLETDSEKIETYKYLAFCYMAENRESEAESAFLKLLKLDKKYVLDPAKTPPKIWKVFEKAKSMVDILPPTIQHKPISSAKPGKLIKIQAIINDDREVKEVHLFFRRKRESNFRRVQMTNLRGETYVAEIPKNITFAGELEYYIEAVDDWNNISRHDIVPIEIIAKKVTGKKMVWRYGKLQSSNTTAYTMSPARYGTLKEDEAWSGIVRVTGDLIIPENVSLKILPRTQIIFAADSDFTSSGKDKKKCELIVNGRIDAQGTEDNTIVFRSDNVKPMRVVGWERNSSWYGITVASKSPESHNVFTYCLISNAYVGIRLENSVATIANSRIELCEYASIQCNRSELEIIQSELINGEFGIIGEAMNLIAVDNSIRSHHFGIDGSFLKAEISDNVFRDNDEGMVMTVLSSAVEIHQNLFIRCQWGITVNLSGMSVLIRDNEMKEMNYDGLVFKGDGKAILRENKLRNVARLKGSGISVQDPKLIVIDGTINDRNDPQTNVIQRSP